MKGKIRGLKFLPSQKTLARALITSIFRRIIQSINTRNTRSLFHLITRRAREGRSIEGNFGVKKRVSIYRRCSGKTQDKPNSSASRAHTLGARFSFDSFFFSLSLAKALSCARKLDWYVKRHDSNYFLSVHEDIRELSLRYRWNKSTNFVQKGFCRAKIFSKFDHIQIKFV